MRELTVEERESIGGGADWNGNGVDDQYEHNVESIGVTSTPPTSVDATDLGWLRLQLVHGGRRQSLDLDSLCALLVDCPK
ncbi:MAG: hypothetical protein H6R02_3172 [Burkholderiaceae bacterium]|nr:hypothetical protein [Burkholderiaceae bacterium]